MKVFSTNIFNIWNTSFSSVNIAQLNSFIGSRWLISVTNFINSDIIGVTQTILIRSLVPSLVQNHNKSTASMFLGWNLQSRGYTLTMLNSSWFVQETSSQSCFDHGRCSAHDLRRFTLQSKLWNWQLKADLFQPNLDKIMAKQLSTQLGNSSLFMSKFYFTTLWEIRVPKSHFHPVLVGRNPLIFISLFPFKHWKHVTCKTEIFKRWKIDLKYRNILSTINLEFFVVNLVENKENVYSPESIHYVNRHYNSVLIQTEW